jgi:hypothetical protein
MSTKPLPPCPVCGSAVRQGNHKDRPFSHKCDGSLDECHMSHGFALCSDEYRALCTLVAKGREKEKET